MGAYMQAGVIGGTGSSSQSSGSPLVPLAPTSFVVSESSSLAVPSNPARRSLVVVNTGEVDVYFGSDQAAVVGKGLVLSPAGTWVMDYATFTLLAIYAVCSSNSNLSIQEYN